MPPHDPSPRAAKRRKTTTNEESSPFHSRVLKTVKQAVYGRPASPKLDDVFAPQDIGLGNAGRVTSRRKALRKVATPVGPGLQSGDGEGEDEGDELEGGGGIVNKGLRSGRRKANGVAKSYGDGAVAGEEELLTPKKGKGKRMKYKGYAWLGENGQVKEGVERSEEAEVDGRDDVQGAANLITDGESSRNGDEPRNTSTKKQRNKHKGWVYPDEDDELAQNNGSREVLGTEMEDTHVNGNAVNGALMESGIDRGRSRRSKGRLGRTPRRPTTKEVEAANGDAVATPASQRKLDRLKRQLEIDMVLEDPSDNEISGSTDGSARQDSTDELAQNPQDVESEQGQLVETLVKKPKKKRLRASPAGEDVGPPFAGVSPFAATLKPVQPEIQDPSGKYADKLQELFENHPEALNTLKTHILSGLTGKRRLPLVKLEDEHQKVYQLVEQTVLAGEGNSMLIIGSRGSGKSTLVETVISELNSDHPDNSHVVRLNGFIHTDDKLALREIWRQLGKEMDVENDDLSGRSHYADTLTSLLALLAHPVGDEDEDQAATSKSVIFILDEFDLFASHPRQTLLYNLFDVAQSRNAPIAVLGLTTKVNVVDSLEKRVKSRFGQRYVHLALPKTFTAFQDICLTALTYHPTTHDLLQPNHTDLQALSRAWNDYLTALFESPSFQHFLQTLYISTKSISSFLSASLLPISLLNVTNLPTATTFMYNSLLPPDSKLSLLPSLSTLSLSLLIAAARLDIILSTPLCTFPMVYDEYVALASKSKMQSSAAGQMAVGGGVRVWSIELAKGAWERLVNLKLVLPAVGGGRGGKGEMWRVDVGLEEIGGCLEGMEGTSLGGLGKWCREI